MNKNVFEISRIQEQFWILHNLFPENTAYNIPAALKITGDINIPALEKSVNLLIQKHEALRASFAELDRKIFQKTRDEENIDYKIECIEMGKSYSEESARDPILKEFHSTFDLTEWPLFRIKLFTFNDRVSILTIVFHHIIVDLRSKQIFEKELSEYYNSITAGSRNIEKVAVRNYSEFSNWLNSWLVTEEAVKKIEEWRNEVPETEELLEIAPDFPRPKINNLEGRSNYFALDTNISRKVKEFAKGFTVDSFTVLLAAYSIFLNRLSNKSGIIIGIPLTNRRDGEFSDTFGCFVNIVPILVKFREGITGKEIIKQVRQSLLRAHRKQEVPFLMINELLRRESRDSILQVGFTFQPPMKLSLSELNIQPLQIERNGSQLDLFLTLWENEHKFEGYLEYSTLLYQENTAQKFIQIYRQTVTSFIQNSDIPTSELEIISDEEASYISEWNNTIKAYEDNICVHQKFEQTVKENPESIALLANNYSITYSQLNEEANRLAHYLIHLGVGIEDRVAICLYRSVEMIVSIFAILKAGAAYLPINPSDPTERISRIFQDADPKLIITNAIAASNLPKKRKRVELENIFKKLQLQSNKNPDVNVKSKNLAYVIYTSGSTGLPKGVMVEHHSVLNRLDWMQNAYPINKSDTILQKTPITFDVSVWEFFWWSFNGARLVLLPKGGEIDPVLISRYIKKYNVTTMHFVPSMFSVFLGTLIRGDKLNELSSLKRLFLSGEALPLKLVKDFNKLRGLYSLPEIINLYGPTEATVDVSFFNCPSGEIENIYIGRPIDNTGLYVLNENYKIQPVDIPGELIITGVNLARGYLNNDKLTGEKFKYFNLIGKENIRGYCTGDIVRLTEKGEIEFFGRKDFQVKIRGFRIELGEIESLLMENPLIEHCAVVLSGNQEEKVLSAFITVKSYKKPEIDTIRIFLKKRLPEYMVPSNFYFLETLPLNTSGKIDRKKLAGMHSNASSKEIIHPKNVYEKILLELWKETLKKDEISIKDNFFDIGGNSLLAINLINRITENFNLDLDITLIFEYPTVRDLSCYLSSITVSHR